MLIEPNTVVACFDAEYTARSETDKGIQEMIQCAMLIFRVDENYQWHFIDKYVDFVRPIYIPKLSDFIMQFTNIKQEDVDGAELFTVAVENIYKLVKKHNVDKIFVWGPDKPVLKYNMELTNYPIRKSKMLLERIYDVSGEISQGMGLDYILSQNHACQELEITPIGHQHDAYCDAENLQLVLEKFTNIKKPA